PPLDVLTPIATPFAADALVVSFPIDGPIATLFPEELTALRRRVATWLVAHGHPIIPIAELERIEAAAAAGTLALEHDQRCVTPPSRAELDRRAFAAHPHAVIQASCDYGGQCSLQVDTLDAKGNALEGFSSTAVRRPEDPAAWLRAVDTLGELRFGSIGLGMIGTGHPPPIQFQPPEGVGPWRHAPALETFTAIEGPASGCAHSDPIVGMSWTLRAAVDRTGALSRCTAEPDSILARASDGECLCRTIGAIDFGAAKAGRRLRVVAVDHDSLSFSPSFAVVQPGTDDWIVRLHLSGVVQRCVTSTQVAPPPGGLDVALTLLPDGTIDDVRIDGALTQQDHMRLARCIVQALPAVALPCAPPGIRTLHARVPGPS
ncbi:MAG: hypothetical protein JNK45_15035, partial [Myxococcales bacterium]|nr:hypothetical protein [Myxococcales bacterium]